MAASRYAFLGLVVLLLDAWFQGPLLGGRVGVVAAVPLALAAAAVLAATVRRRPPRRPDRREVAAIVAVLAVATLIRLPALFAPASLISSDSAVAGIIAQDLDAGRLPAPVYAPGFPYEGTLKPHLTVVLARATGAPLPAAYAWASHLFHLLWTVAVMVLGRRVAGAWGALAAGLFMAVSPRFLVAFSLNNVGQYPEVNALGTLALVLLGGGRVTAAGLLLGLAVWQQLLGVYFVLTAAVLILMTPAFRRPAAVLAAAAGFVAGSYPIWIWNAGNAWATFDLFRRGGKQPADRIAQLPDRLERTLSVSFPKLFGATDLGLEGALALLFGLVLPALVLCMALSRRHEVRAARGRSAVTLAVVLFAVVVSVFAVSKFSNRGAQRPRYLMPLYTSSAVALGWAAASLSRRSRLLGAGAVAAVLAANGAGIRPWLQGRPEAEARDRAILAALDRFGVRTGYAGFWVAPKYTFLSEGRMVLSGELGPVVSWVHPAHAARVREEGPDGLIVERGPLADALAARLAALGITHARGEVAGLTVLHGFARKPTLEELEGYDAQVGYPPVEGEEDDAPL